MKYRRLTLEELESLEQEFVKYLVINSITADDWVKIKEEEPEKAERIIELFSDSVFDKILRDVQFLEFRSSKELFAYQCLSEKIVLIGIKAKNKSIDLTDKQKLDNALQNSEPGLSIFTTEKKYSIDREMELFDMIENGCEISNGKIFKLLCLAL